MSAFLKRLRRALLADRRDKSNALGLFIMVLDVVIVAHPALRRAGDKIYAQACIHQQKVLKKRNWKK